MHFKILLNLKEEPEVLVASSTCMEWQSKRKELHKRYHIILLSLQFIFQYILLRLPSFVITAQKRSENSPLAAEGLLAAKDKTHYRLVKLKVLGALVSVVFDIGNFYQSVSRICTCQKCESVSYTRHMYFSEFIFMK